jgi:hypothetical protein
MPQDSDVIVDFFGVVVWFVVFVLSLMIVVLQCPLPRRFVRYEPSDVINVVPTFWDWYLYHI